MLKRELVNKVSDELQGYYKKDIAMAVDLILEAVGSRSGALVAFRSGPVNHGPRKIRKLARL